MLQISISYYKSVISGSKITSHTLTDTRYLNAPGSATVYTSWHVYKDDMRKHTRKVEINSQKSSLQPFDMVNLAAD